MRAAAPAVIDDDSYLAHLVPDECVLGVDLDPAVVHACCSVTVNASPVATDAPASSKPALMAARPAGGTCLSECESSRCRQHRGAHPSCRPNTKMISPLSRAVRHTSAETRASHKQAQGLRRHTNKSRDSSMRSRTRLMSLSRAIVWFSGAMELPNVPWSTR